MYATAEQKSPPTLTYDQVKAMSLCAEGFRDATKKLGGIDHWKVTPVTIRDMIAADVEPKDIILMFCRDDVIGDRLCRLFACAAAKHVLPSFEEKYPDDKRPRIAIETARRFADGGATEDELRIARVAARAAVRTTARDTVVGPAGVAAADAAWRAARDIVGAATGPAAWHAARAIAGVVAWDATWASLATLLAETVEGEA